MQERSISGRGRYPAASHHEGPGLEMGANFTGFRVYHELTNEVAELLATTMAGPRGKAFQETCCMEISTAVSEHFAVH
jgi:hypothetical protein